MLKKKIKSILSKCVAFFSTTRVGRVFSEVMLSEAMQRKVQVKHDDVELTFVTPNPLLLWRATTFSEKEPETLTWIDGFDEGDVLWDIGANVGLYSLYAARAKNADVYAFEPSIFNLEILGRNIAANKLMSKISIMPLALSNASGHNLMKHSTTQWGGALSSFGADFGADGEALDEELSYKTFGITADELIKHGYCPLPNHIKIDVDGIEHFILSGASNVLSKASSVLIEINDDFKDQREKTEYLLMSAGLTLIEKKRSDLITVGDNFTKNIYNQIWKRD